MEPDEKEAQTQGVGFKDATSRNFLSKTTQKTLFPGDGAFSFVYGAVALARSIAPSHAFVCTLPNSRWNLAWISLASSGPADSSCLTSRESCFQSGSLAAGGPGLFRRVMGVLKDRHKWVRKRH